MCDCTPPLSVRIAGTAASAVAVKVRTCSGESPRVSSPACSRRRPNAAAMVCASRCSAVAEASMLDAMLAYIGPSRAAASCNYAVRTISSCCSRSARATRSMPPTRAASAAPDQAHGGAPTPHLHKGLRRVVGAARQLSRLARELFHQVAEEPARACPAPAPRFWRRQSGVRVRRARHSCFCASVPMRRSPRAASSPDFCPAFPTDSGWPSRLAGRRQPCRYPGLPGDIGFNRDRQGLHQTPSRDTTAHRGEELPAIALCHYRGGSHRHHARARRGTR